MNGGCAGCLLHSNKLLLSPEPHLLCAAKSCMFAGDSMLVFLPRPCWLISVISGGLVSTVTSNYHCSLDCQSYHQQRRGRCVILYIGIKCLYMSCYSLNANPDAGLVQIAHSAPCQCCFCWYQDMPNSEKIQNDLLWSVATLAMTGSGFQQQNDCTNGSSGRNINRIAWRQFFLQLCLALF